jgi:hypothetical protein
MKLFKKTEAKKPVAGELSLTELQSVSGGLNPQPLPPRIAYQTFSSNRTNVLRAIPNEPI